MTSSNTNGSPSSELKAPPLEQYQLQSSKLYKAYFNDPTLSDVTIILSDRTVHAHRIVLCRGSEYFTGLLTGRFKEARAKEIELRDNDSDAMIALLHFLYGLSYTEEATQKWHTSLQPHAMVYVVAHKYQIGALQEQTCNNMRKMMKSDDYMALTTTSDLALFCLKNANDFIGTPRIILAGTVTQDSQGRKMIMTFLIQNIDNIRHEDEFMSLLKGLPDLGAEILGHRDLACEAQGFWHCDDMYCATNVPCCKKCKYEFEPHVVPRYRYEQLWPCELCKTVAQAICRGCLTGIKWVPFSQIGVPDTESSTSDD